MAAAAASSSSATPDFDDFTPDELLVSQILLELPLLFHNSPFSPIPTWSFRRKRSALDSPPQPPPSPSKILKESSPTTPLSLTSSKSRSESEENNANANAIAIAKSSKKKPSPTPTLTLNKKSQYLDAIDELTKQNQVLEGNVEAVKQHYTHLKSINSELKLKKQEMILESKNKSRTPEIATSSSATKIKFTVKSSTLGTPPPPPPHQNQFQPPLTAAPTAEPSYSQNLQFQFGAIPFYDPSSMEPMGIPDLNLSPEEISQRNYSRFMAARARQNRIQICKSKNNGASKFHN